MQAAIEEERAKTQELLAEERRQAAEREREIELNFENQGNTIPPEKLQRIFEQFFRLDSSRSSSTGGAGLGLAISKEIVELHGGKIQAESADEQIVFTLWLPQS